MKPRRFFFEFLQFLDLLIVALSFFHLYTFSGTYLPELFKITDQLWFLPMYMVSIHFSFVIYGLYQFEKKQLFLQPLYYVFPAVAFGAALSFAMLYLTKNLISRLFIFAMFIYIALAIFAARLIVSATYRKLNVGKGRGSRNIMIIGANTEAGKFAKVIEENPEFENHIIGFLCLEAECPSSTFQDKPILGSVYELENILRKNSVDEVIFCVKHGWVPETLSGDTSKAGAGGLDKFLLICEEMGVTVRLFADYFNLMLAKTSLEDYFGVPLLTFKTTPEDRTYELFIKRTIDIFVSFFGLIFLSPMFLLIVVLIKIKMPGPVFFVHRRAGLYKRPFNLYKFRSMVANAEELRKDLSNRNEMDGPAFKIVNDPRVTPLGRFLRRFSLDEFPQLWNVLLGHMSLVGPRPPTLEEVEKYERWQLRRLSMRPGITCIWQVSGRNEIGFMDWMKMDLYYIDHWSLWLDFKLLIQTIPAVIFGRGAS